MSRAATGTPPSWNSVSLALDAGSVTAVVGENGAGKTTLIKSVVGLIKFEGTITVGGVDVARKGKDTRRMIGYLPQIPAFHGDLSVRETALLYAALKRVGRPRSPQSHRAGWPRRPRRQAAAASLPACASGSVSPSLSSPIPPPHPG